MNAKLAVLLVTLACGSIATLAQDLRRATVWDLKIGQPVSAQPSPAEFRAFACGANGGPPRAPLSGWHDFARCPADDNGLHEVYFEYDDEYEYIARARDLPREIARWAGTTEATFPVVASGLFDREGMLKAIRIVTDPRPDYRNEATEAEIKKRASAYLLGGIMAARFDIDPARDCTLSPPVDGESAVGSLFVKQSCEKIDTATGRKFILHVNYFRKRGQSGTHPHFPSQLTQGQFESSARLEIHRHPAR